MNAVEQKMNESSTLVPHDLNLKIFIINRYFPPSSVYRWTQDLSSIFGVKATVVNLIFNTKDANNIYSGTSFNGKFIKFPYLNYLFQDIAFANARKYIENLSLYVDHAIIHYTNQFSGILKISGAKTIVNVQDSPYYVEGSSFIERQYLMRLYNSIKKQKYITTNTNHLKNELIDFGFEGEITTVYLPYSQKFRRLSMEKKEIRMKLGLPLDKKLVLSVSTDSPRKNLPMVRKVLDGLGDDFRLVRVGTPLGNSITFGGIDDETLNELYNACDVLLFPSLYEGFGLPIVEAFASGLPVVTSDIPTIREVAGDAAVLCDPHDVEDLKSGLVRALSIADDLTRRGMERSMKFTFGHFKDEILALYERIVRDL